MRFGTIARAVAVLLAGLALVACGRSEVPGAGYANGAAGPIKVLSTRPDLISGGDALIEIQLPSGVEADQMRVDLAGRDVTGQFARRDDGRYLGLITGLPAGKSTLIARSPVGIATLDLVNYPIGGPIFSGPQIQPWYCLDGALDAQCNRPTTYTWWYKSTDSSKPGFQPYDPDQPPSDVAETTTDQGKTVPYIVREETGNMDRNQYKIAVLADPDRPFDRWSGPPAWNHKVFVPHGAGCSTSHAEGTTQPVRLDWALSHGFAVMSTALSDNTWSCNLAVQAESIAMAKEHLVEAYGDVRYQIGVGCSGGSIASLTMANAYPGLYDGLVIACIFANVPVNDLLDCKALLRYWENPAAWAPGVAWEESQQAAAAGLASTSVCHAWVEAYRYPDLFEPRTGVGCRIPDHEPEKVYNAQTNPEGIRCSWQDHIVNIVGLRGPERWGPVEQQIGRGFANRPFDNVGVQYGLRALEAGAITTAQFLDLNAKIGAHDIDYAWQSARVDADPDGLGRAYRGGVINSTTSLDRIAIIDIPGWIPGDRYEIHDNQQSWGLRARLRAAHGADDNHVLWYGNRSGQNIMGDTEAFAAMDRWLAAVEADSRDVPRARKIVEDRPQDVHDRCDSADPTTCESVYGPAANPRYAAGMKTLANDIVKCQLKPLLRSDYAVTFTDPEWAQLQEIFPSGVCNYDTPGVDQQPTVPWLDYTGGPGGRAMPPAPLPESWASPAFRTS